MIDAIEMNTRNLQKELGCWAGLAGWSGWSLLFHTIVYDWSPRKLSETMQDAAIRYASFS